MEELGMQDVIEKLSGMDEDDMEEMDEALIQQIQLFNVALKQEDGEPVTESEISFLGESNKYLRKPKGWGKKSGLASKAITRVVGLLELNG